MLQHRTATCWIDYYPGPEFRLGMLLLIQETNLRFLKLMQFDFALYQFEDDNLSIQPKCNITTFQATDIYSMFGI